MRTTYALMFASACASRPAPRPIANVQPPPTPATVTCFAGEYTGFDGERVAIVMRRTVDPAAASIRQEAVREAGGSVLAGEVTLAVTGSTFRSKTPESARGEGRFDGPAWSWKHWTEERHHKGDPPWTEAIEGWLEAGHLRFRGRDVDTSSTWSAELDVFECSEYGGRIAGWQGVTP